jgi:hypothetical protein
MKNKILLSILLTTSALVLVCNSAWSQQDYKELKKYFATASPIINSAQWENTTRDIVYSNCIIALHLQGYELDPLMISKESGLIVTRPSSISLPIWQDNLSSGEYFLSILVYETAGNKIAINIQINGTKLFDYESDPKGGFAKIAVPNGEKRNISRYDASEMWNGLNNNVSEDIDRLFTKLESIQGKAISKETTTLKWK